MGGCSQSLWRFLKCYPNQPQSWHVTENFGRTEPSMTSNYDQKARCACCSVEQKQTVSGIYIGVAQRPVMTFLTLLGIWHQTDRIARFLRLFHQIIPSLIPFKLMCFTSFGARMGGTSESLCNRDSNVFITSFRGGGDPGIEFIPTRICHPSRQNTKIY